MEFIVKIGKSFAIGTIMGIIIAFITSKFVPDLIDRLEHQSYYFRYYWKYMELNKDKKSDIEDDETGIYIIDIDDRSQNKLGMYWNWNRSYHAQMVNTLNNNFPAAVVFDINFYDPEDKNHRHRIDQLLVRTNEVTPGLTLSDDIRRSILSAIDYDKQLINATDNSGVVYHGLRLSSDDDYPDVHKTQNKRKKTMAWHDSLNPGSTIEIASQSRLQVNSEKNIIDGIFPQLASKAKAIGHLNMFPNDDGVIREVNLLYGFGKNKPVYLPISVRTVASLFGTPKEEIHFEPGRYLDIGKPFKIFKHENGRISFSYPNFSVSQLKAILNHGQEILSLKPGEKVSVSSLLKIGRDSNGEMFIATFSGEFPQPIVLTFQGYDMNKILTLNVSQALTLAPEIVITRDSDEEWILTAPYGDEEWYVTKDDLTMISHLKFDEFQTVKNGQTRLIFHNFKVRNKDNILLSSIPVLRDKTLKELCQMTWEEIVEMKPGLRRDIGENVRIPLTPKNEHIVTFFGKRKETFRYYSFYDILKDRVQGSLDGKVYLVGSTVSGMFDIVSVPVENVYPGVEVHASLINSFITNTFVKRLEGWQDFMILLLTGIVIGILAYMLKPLPSAILTIVFIFAYFLLAMTVFGTEYLWIEIARPILTIILTYTAIMAYRYITEEKDRKFLQNTFKQYLSPELIDTMYREKQMPKLGGDEGIRTAFFSDIQSFSTFSEKLGSPTRLVDLLNEYLTEMTDSLLTHFGTLDKYEGDAIVAFFGAPMPMEDHAQQACAAALDMQRKLTELRIKWKNEGDKWPQIVHNMRMRIGINTGPITTGNMGSAVRMNYTMMGDAVNLAARLESAAKQYGIYTMISEYTYDIVKNEFTVRQLDKITVVGKSEPVVIYELLGRKGSLDAKIRNLIEVYQAGLDYFYEQKWDLAIKTLQESEMLEPYKHFSAGGINPSRKIILSCEEFKLNPPGDDWDGVMKLTSK